MRLAQQELWLLPLKDLFVVLGCCNSRGFQKRLHTAWALFILGVVVGL